MPHAPFVIQKNYLADDPDAGRSLSLFAKITLTRFIHVRKIHRILLFCDSDITWFKFISINWEEIYGFAYWGFKQ